MIKAVSALLDAFITERLNAKVSGVAKMGVLWFDAGEPRRNRAEKRATRILRISFEKTEITY